MIYCTHSIPIFPPHIPNIPNISEDLWSTDPSRGQLAKCLKKGRQQRATGQQDAMIPILQQIADLSWENQRKTHRKTIGKP